ncbi:Ras family protein [Onchocerca flexuosa]|uniref:Ras family protein n=1 Tax=Onchocerca flexuosa TaxID=387005 RepID=A0A238BU40_9BILA|nr:Ras family protein [Onchocerca flexuosa]
MKKKSLSILTEIDYSFTVMLIGDSCCGKTCLLIRFKDNTFLNNNFISTVGIDYRIWDTAGQERFLSITTTYYRGADALLLVYDLTNRQSFINIRDWLARIKENAKETVLIILVGNKMDLQSSREVKYEEGKQLAETNNIAFIETSAKSGQNVQKTFQEVARKLVRMQNGENVKNKSTIELADSTLSNISSCCLTS